MTWLQDGLFFFKLKKMIKRVQKKKVCLKGTRNRTILALDHLCLPGNAFISGPRTKNMAMPMFHINFGH
jgi:hypothetical protein